MHVYLPLEHMTNLCLTGVRLSTSQICYCSFEKPQVDRSVCLAKVGCRANRISSLYHRGCVYFITMVLGGTAPDPWVHMVGGIELANKVQHQFHLLLAACPIKCLAIPCNLRDKDAFSYHWQCMCGAQFGNLIQPPDIIAAREIILHLLLHD